MHPLAIGLLGKVVDTVASFIDPAKKAEAELAILKLHQENEFKEIDTLLNLAKQQNDINLEQAKSDKFFVSGPRPALMWVGVAGLAYQWLVVPIGLFAYAVAYGKPFPVPPPVMSPELLTMMASLMGLQIGFRSWEKVKRNAS